MLSERLLIILGRWKRGKMIERRLFLKGEPCKQIPRNRRQDKQGAEFHSTGAFTGTSYTGVTSQGRRPHQRLTHMDLPDATEDPLAMVANAFRFPFGVLSWRGTTLPDATTKYPTPLIKH